ncbi:MAG: hypothetical protein ACT6FE_00910 [Methanosarcinaceae archaeon]
MEKKDFINQILKLVNKSLEIKTKMDSYIPCDIFSEEDYNKLFKETMPLNEFKQFKDHCQNCPACRKGIIQTYERFLLKEDQNENFTLFQKTLDLLDRIDKPGINVMDIVINSSKKILEVIKTTSEVLSTPLLVPSRGKDGKQQEEQPIRILQEFDHPLISVQASFRTDKAGQIIEMWVSLLDKKTEEFMANIEITLTGPGKKQKKSTDENGKAIFFLQGSGNYNAVMVSGEDQIVKLNMKID